MRGFELSNMTIVEGERWILVIDPLLCAGTAATGLALYQGRCGDRRPLHPKPSRPFRRSAGVGEEGVANGLSVFAPHGFLEHAVSENVYAGTAMNRRAAYM